MDVWDELSAAWPPPELIEVLREVSEIVTQMRSLTTPEERAIIEEIWRQRREAMDD